MVSMMLHSLLYGVRETPGNNLGVHYALSLWHLIYSKAAPYSTKKSVNVLHSRSRAVGCRNDE